MKIWARIRTPLVFVVLTGCVSSNIEMSGLIDPADKTVTIAPGNSLLLGPIKQGLRTAGWRISVDRARVRTTGTLGQSTNLETGDVFRTRYRLVLRQQQFDTCLGTGLPAVAYDLSLIDNSSGDEVLTASGKDCTDLASRWFLNAVNSGGKGYCTSSLGRYCSGKTQ